MPPKLRIAFLTHEPFYPPSGGGSAEAVYLVEEMARRWAELPDSQEVPVETSLRLLETVQERWVAIMRSMTDAQWQRAYMHPEHGRYPLDRQAALYAWHGKHHVAHITRAT